MDLVVVHGTYHLTFLQNTGNVGSNGWFTTHTVSHVGYGLESVIAEDLDGNGFPDLALANLGLNDTGSVIIFQNTDGRFFFSQQPSTGGASVVLSSRRRHRYYGRRTERKWY